MTKLNVGCGGRPLIGYINIDKDTIDDLRIRYPLQTFENDLIIQDLDIFSLPYDSNSIDEVNADGLLEHLSFSEESKFLYEIKRILKPEGIFKFSVPDFEEVCKIWLNAKDDWKEFYSNTPENIEKKHWFGTYTYDYINRWGYLTATIYGSQNGEGQYHKNCYSEEKIKAMLQYIGYKKINIDKFLWKGDRDPMLQCFASKE